jgi:hypothetical protein
MSKPQVLVTAWLLEGMFDRFRAAFPEVDFLDGREPAGLDRHLGQAII